MAVHDAAGPSQFIAVVTGHRISVSGGEVVDAEAIAPVLTPRTVQIVAVSQMQPHMGAALRGAEEDQISRLQQIGLPDPPRHRAAEALLQVGVAG